MPCFLEIPRIIKRWIKNINLNNNNYANIRFVYNAHFYFDYEKRYINVSLFSKKNKPLIQIKYSSRIVGVMNNKQYIVIYFRAYIYM